MGRLILALEASSAKTRIVGGAVRDALLEQPVSDIDFATTLLPGEVLERLEAAGIRAVPTGLRHGTVTAIVGGQPHEITTLRRDVETDGRHARIAFTDDWQADASRRDFTINALYADPLTGAIFDYVTGLADLSTRTVRFIGDPLLRIAEDHLRILRFFRFSARFSDVLEPSGLAACAARARDLMALSRERIRDELLKLLVAPRAVPTLAAMCAHGILAPVLPEADDVAALAALAEVEQRAGVAPDPLRRLASLLPADAQLAAQVASRLRLSNSQKMRLVAAAERTPVPDDPRALAYAIGPEATLDRLLLTGDLRAAAWAGQLRTWKRPRLPVSGKDLIQMGVPPGPEVSRLLREVEGRWVAAGFPPDRSCALALARQAVGLR
ncbi:MAG: CCA tRNA nucleotidyltransferase [Sphingomonadaceae bacterium]